VVAGHRAAAVALESLGTAAQVAASVVAVESAGQPERLDIAQARQAAQSNVHRISLSHHLFHRILDMNSLTR
jgi:hypothetical protein